MTSVVASRVRPSSSHPLHRRAQEPQRVTRRRDAGKELLREIERLAQRLVVDGAHAEAGEDVATRA